MNATPALSLLRSLTESLKSRWKSLALKQESHWGALFTGKAILTLVEMASRRKSGSGVARLSRSQRRRRGILRPDRSRLYLICRSQLRFFNFSGISATAVPTVDAVADGCFDTTFDVLAGTPAPSNPALALSTLVGSLAPLQRWAHI